ncbi:hypothetical protein ACWDE9_37560 [Streptomyces olivaceoviridis]
MSSITVINELEDVLDGVWNDETTDGGKGEVDVYVTLDGSGNGGYC